LARPKVYVTRKLPSPGLEIVSEVCDVVLHEDDQPPSREEIIRNIVDKDGILCLLTDKMDSVVMDAAPKLKVISSVSVGYDHIDVAAATKRGIYVTYTPGVLTEATADFTWTLMMSIARRLCEADRYVRAGRWKISWSPTMMLGEDVYGRTLGIIGLGRIGAAMAKRARGFNMKVLYYDIQRPPSEKEAEFGVQYAPLEELLKQSDFISIHIPLMKETYHFIDEEKLKMMKPTALFINTSRGPIVDQKALAKALNEGWIAGAALDVFEKEPIDMNDPLLKLENVILALHIASATKQSRSKMAELAAKNLVAVLKGEEPLHLVNSEVMKIRPLSQVKTV